ncbi:MAG: M23 family metallopeptidase [Patescibacteria group bacterium]
MRRYLLAVFGIFSIAASNIGYAASVVVFNPAVRQGETLVMKFSEVPKSAVFNGKEIVVFPYQNDWRAIVPLPLSMKTGAYRLTAEFSGGTSFEKNTTVLKKPIKTITLPPPPKLGLTDKEIVQNLAVANSGVRKTVEEVKDATLFAAPFGLPLADNRKISSPFGEIRKTGEESITHLGTDFDAAKGRAVGAINAGTVKSAYFDSIYGNSVIIDHGRGIYSLYIHLNTMKVKAGDAVKKGTLVGTVGDSGLASAPHLHLSIKVGGVSVDPVQFVRVFK